MDKESILYETILQQKSEENETNKELTFGSNPSINPTMRERTPLVISTP
jgi:hypothetical protein